jgi:hypothetical protein
LIGSGGHELGLLVGRMRQLIAALAHLAVLFEQAIRGANRAVILAFIEQCRINRSWRAILEAFGVKMRQDRFAVCWLQCAYRRRSWHAHHRERSGTSFPVRSQTLYLSGLPAHQCMQLTSKEITATSFFNFSCDFRYIRYN